MTEVRNQASHGFGTVGRAVIDDEGVLILTQTDGTQSEAAGVGLISNIVDANNVGIVTSGYMDGLSGLAPNTIYYAGNDGVLTSDVADLDDWMTPILVSISATEGYVVPQIPVSLALIPSSALEGLSTDITLASNSNLEFPSVKAVKNYIDVNGGGLGLPLGAAVLWPRADSGSIPTGYSEVTTVADYEEWMFIRRDDAAPTVVSATILASGDEMEVKYNEAVTFAGGGADNLTITLTGGAITEAYASGKGTATLTYDLNRSVTSSETGDVDGAQVAAGVQDLAGNLVTAFTNLAITNNSAVGGTCNVAKDAVTTSDNSGAFSFNFGQAIWAVQFTAGSSYTCCAMDWFTSINGTPNGTLVYAEIYADDGGGAAAKPTGAALTTSDGIAFTAIVNGGLTKFGNMSEALVSGTKYWRALRTTPDNTIYLRLHVKNDTGALTAYNDGSWTQWVERLVNGTLYAAS